MIKNPILLLNDFNNFSKIKRNGVVLTKAEMNSLKCSIKQWNDTTLEEMLSEIENNWKLICEKLKLFRNNYLSSNDKEKCVKEYLNPIWHYIENFVNILYIRNNEFRDSVHEYTKPIKDISYSIFENFNIINNMVETHYKNTLKQALLKEYSIFKTFNINLYLLNDNQNVILPLNYVRIIENTEIDGILLQSAIYIPLTPQIIAIVYGEHSNLITINHNLLDEYVNAINKCLIYNSKYFVANFKVDEICNLQITPN